MKLSMVTIFMGILLVACEKEPFLTGLDEPNVNQTVEMRGPCIEGTISVPGNLEFFELSDQEAIDLLGGDLSAVRFTAKPAAMPYAFLFTDDFNQILYVSRSNTLDITALAATPGVYRVWAFSYLGNILAEPGMYADDAYLASYCFQLTTNYIRISNRMNLLKQYAPQLKFHSNETFFPASVQWSFQFLERYLFSDDHYRLRTILPLSVPAVGTFHYGNHLPFFHGNLESAKQYAYWVERPEVEGGVLDLVYFTYYPWNLGKKVGGTVYGNHVGDWENVVVRMKKEGMTYLPVKMIYAAHNFVKAYDWPEVEKTPDGHPVVYVASGSHGSWVDIGVPLNPLDPSITGHKYQSFPALGDFTNNSGLRWNSWNALEAYDFTKGEDIQGNPMPPWMSNDYTNPGTGDPTDPASGPVYRWGNNRQRPIAGYYRLETGPTGPVEKAQLKDPLWSPQ